MDRTDLIDEKIVELKLQQKRLRRRMFLVQWATVGLLVVYKGEVIEGVRWLLALAAEWILHAAS